METDSNFGVLNIPDYLGIEKKKNYFVNYAGLHPVTIQMALDKHQPELQLTQEQIDRTISALKDVMMSELSH
jgi:2-isopropylmalate synthase